MAISPSDIRYVLSGGAYNNDPYKSLGGEPSSHIVWGVSNNLFNDVSDADAKAGNVDYRCIYVVNNNSTFPFYDVHILIENQATGGSNIEIGVPIDTDIQHIVITGTVTSGSYTISYEGQNLVIGWSPYLSTWAKNLQDALNSISDLGGIVVSATSHVITSGNINYLFEVRFEGVSNYRYHPTLQLVSNNLSGQSSIDIIKIQNGCPINAIAATIETSIAAPFGIVWVSPDDLSPLGVGVLKAGYFFPVWIKRTTSPATAPLAADGFTLKVLGRPFA